MMLNIRPYSTQHLFNLNSAVEPTRQLLLHCPNTPLPCGNRQLLLHCSTSGIYTVVRTSNALKIQRFDRPRYGSTADFNDRYWQ